MKDELNAIIEEMEQNIASLNERIDMYGMQHNATRIRLSQQKKAILRYLPRLKNIYEAAVSEASKCVKCGKTYIPRLFKPMTICEDCYDKLG